MGGVQWERVGCVRWSRCVGGLGLGREVCFKDPVYICKVQVTIFKLVYFE